MQDLNRIGEGPRPAFFVAIIGSFLWLVLLTPTLIESDAYRYATLILVAAGLFYFWKYRSFVRLHWTGWLCIAWGLYATARFLILYFDGPVHQKGASEWLYIFPIFFPLLGITLFVFRPHVEKIVALYFAAVLVFLLVTTQYVAILGGEAITPLIQNNRIHGAVACGLMMISAFFWLMHYTRGEMRSAHIAKFALAAAPVIITLALLNIYGSKSKGVWLATAITFPVMFLLAQTYMRAFSARCLSLAILAVLIGGIALFWQNLIATTGPTLSAIGAGWNEYASGGDISKMMNDSIASDQTPLSMNERLQLWSNAWEVFSAAPLFGQGNHWLDSWKLTRYSKVGYTLIHNGYMEIAIRHGIFGLAVFFVLLAGFLSAARNAQKLSLMSLPALHCYYATIIFFCVTLLSNSNNRLAIGEMFFLLVGAIAISSLIAADLLRKQQRAQATSTTRPSLPQESVLPLQQTV